MRLLRVLFALLLTAPPAWAASTVNPAVPVLNAPLTSAPVRNNFAAAAADINNILGMFGSASQPALPAIGQDWLNTTTATWIWGKWDGLSWVPVAAINSLTHQVSFYTGGAAMGAPGSAGLSLVSNGVGSSPTYQLLTNSGLQYSSVTIAGHTIALGGTSALAASDLSNGTTGSGAVVLSPGGVTVSSGKVLTVTSTNTLSGTDGAAYTLPSSSKTLAANDLSNLTTTLTPMGRLTLVSGTPVMTTSQSGIGTIYYTPYNGNFVPVYNGTSFTGMACPEISNIAANSALGNAGPTTVVASSVYDLFVWNNAGTCTLTRGPVWTNSTTRSAGTALTRLNGIYVNSLAIINGPGASQGTYVGTVASNASATIDYIFGGAGSGGVAGSLMVWNQYNRVLTTTVVTDSGAGYTYSSSTIRGARGPNNNHIQFVLGNAEDEITAQYNTSVSLVAVAGNFADTCIGLDSTTTCTGAQQQAFSQQASVAPTISMTPVLGSVPGIGAHAVSANEVSDGTHSNTFNALLTNQLIVTLRN